MRVLAIDTALGACAAAVLDSSAGAILANESLGMLRGHAEAIMPLIARVMDAARCEFTEVDRIAVTVGPTIITGSGAALVAAHWPSGSPVPHVEPHVAPDIGWVARLGAAAQDEGTAPKPLYLRRPDARPQDAGRLPRR